MSDILMIRYSYYPIFSAQDFQSILNLASDELGEELGEELEDKRGGAKRSKSEEEARPRDYGSTRIKISL